MGGFTGICERGLGRDSGLLKSCFGSNGSVCHRRMSTFFAQRNNAGNNRHCLRDRWEGSLVYVSRKRLWFVEMFF